MATTTKKVTSKTGKKELGQDLQKKLEIALESFKDILGDKKFQNRIKKATKIILKGTGKKTTEQKTTPTTKKKETPRKA